MLSERKNHLKNNDWRFIYTDGTKSQNNIPAYAIVDEEGRKLILGTLFENSSVFSAESCAIYQAIRFILTDKKKTVIFTDSLSVIKSISNPFNSSWNIIVKIRDCLIANPNIIKIHWVPSHVGIVGNEKADIAAKYASYAPIITDCTLEKSDIHHHIVNQVRNKFNQKTLSHHHYSNINPHRNHPVYPVHIGKDKIRTFSRLRLGHTIFSHEWILKNPSQTPTCNHCNSSLTVKHILMECPLFSYQRHKMFGNVPALDLLKFPSSSNIDKIFNFIKLTKLKI